MKNLFSKKNKYIYITFIFSLIFFFGGLPFYVFSQEESVPNESFFDLSNGIDFDSLDEAKEEELEKFLKVQTLKEEGGNQCFFYKDIRIDVSSEILRGTAGENMHFSGTLENLGERDFPDVSLFAKILYKNNQEIDNTRFEYIDYFFIKENFSLEKEKETPLSFEWNVPKNASSGEYQIIFFLSSGDTIFPLTHFLGKISFLGSFDFSIAGSDIREIFIDSRVLIDGKEFFAKERYREFTESENPQIQVALKNDTDKAQAISVRWSLYEGFGFSEDTILHTEEEEIFLSSGSSQELSYTLKDKNSSKYIVVGEIVSDGMKSFVEIPLKRKDMSSVHFSSLSLSKYPLISGEENSISSCFSLEQEEYTISTLTLTLKDDNGQAIYQKMYEEDFKNKQFSKETLFSLEQDYTTFSLLAEIEYMNGKKEFFEVLYDCNIYNSCVKNTSDDVFVETTEKKDLSIHSFFRDNISIFLLLGGGLFLLIILFFVVRRWGPRVSLGVFFLVVFFSLSLQGVQAKSVVVTNSLPNLFEMNRSGPPIFSDYNARISYNVILVDEGGVQILDNTILPVGKKFSIKLERQASDIIFSNASNATYGLWKKDAEPPSSGEYSLYQLEEDVYGAFSVHPRDMTIVATGNISCIGTECEVEGTGNISISLQFPWSLGFVYVYREGAWRLTATNPSSGIPYAMFLPSQNITYTLSGSTSSPPTEPLISGDTTGRKADPVTIRLHSTDPDGDDIRYQIEWLYQVSPGVSYSPFSGYVASGTERSIIHYATSKLGGNFGSYSFRARTCDRGGSCSSWKSGEFLITSASGRPVPACTFSGDHIIDPGTTGYNLDGLIAENLLLHTNYLHEISTSLAVGVSPGRYRLEMHAWDGYETRDTSTPPQPHENFYGKFLSETNEELYRSESTDDLPADFKEISVINEFSPVILEKEAKTFVFRHSQADNLCDASAGFNCDSVIPVCASLQKIEEHLVLCQQGISEPLLSTKNVLTKEITLPKESFRQFRALYNEGDSCDDSDSRNVTSQVQWTLGDPTIFSQILEDPMFRNFKANEIGSTELVLRDSITGKELTLDINVVSPSEEIHSPSEALPVPMKFREVAP